MKIQKINYQVQNKQKNNEVAFCSSQSAIRKIADANVEKLTKLSLGEKFNNWVKSFLFLKNVEAGSYKVKPHFEPYQLFAKGDVEIPKGAKVKTDYYAKNFTVSGKTTKDAFLHAQEQIIVKPGAKIKSSIEAQRVDILGVVDGDIYAKEVNIYANAGGRATGKIFAETVNGQKGIANKEEIPEIVTIKADEIVCGRIKGKILNLFGKTSKKANLDFETINNFSDSPLLGEINYNTVKQMNHIK